MTGHPPADKAVRDEAATDLKHSIFLEAGAGTGKTDSLVRRYLHILETPPAEGGADVENIVAITFTNKAAREMKDRVRRECTRRAAQAPPAEGLTWRRRGRELEGAPIGTIHSFCAGILRRFPVEARVDPQFGVLDDITGRNLLSDAVRETLLDRLDRNEATAALTVATLDLGRALEAIEFLIGAHGEAAADLLTSPPDRGAVRAAWESDLLKALAGDEQLAKALADLQQVAPLDETDLVAQQRQAALTALAAVLDSKRPVTARMQALRSAAGLKLTGGKQKSWGGKEALDQAKAAVRAAHDAAALGSDWDCDVEARAAEATAALYAEASAALQAYENEKQNASVLDYDDLQLKARDLLRDNAAVRAYYRRRYRHILVDEFQDTNALQREIIWHIADGSEASGASGAAEAPGRLFVVGDAKQSIYAFRGADVSVFNRTRAEFAHDDARCRVLRLEVNFRSQPALTAFHNDLFSREQVMGGDRHGRAEYEAHYAPLKAHRTGLDTGPAAGFLVAEPPASPGAQDGEAEETGAEVLREAEANLIADHIKGLLGKPIVGESQPGGDAPRPSRPGDFALLFRATRDMPVYERALRQREIPFYTVAGHGFYARQEVKDLLNLLRALENANDEVSLVGALRSPLFGLSDRTLFWLTDPPAEGPLLSNLHAAAGEGPDAHPHAGEIAPAEREKVAFASRVLSDLGELKNRLPLSALLSRAVQETGFTSALAAQWGAEQMVANVRSLIQMAGSFERQGRYSLRDFVEYLQELVVREERQGLAPLEEEQSPGSVKLMTIHAAKGLEWPIVIVPDLARGQPHDTGRFRFHRRYGAAVRVEGDDGDSGWPVVGKLIGAQTDREGEAESRRLLYVVCTRARDRLILSTWRPKQSAGEWLKWLTQGEKRLLDPESDEPVAGEGWRLEARHAQPADVAPPAGEPGRTKPLFERYRERVESLTPLPSGDASLAERLRKQIEPTPPTVAANARFTVTQLCAYRRCPREYELRYVRCLPEAPSASDLPIPAGGLSPIDRGLLVHRVLQIVGRGGKAHLEDALRIAGTGRSLAEHEVGAVREMCIWYLTQPAYTQQVAAADKLRTEMPLLFPLDGALIEGKIDALAEQGSEMHLFDYKTGREPKGETLEEHAFQVGLYALGVRSVLGRDPSYAAIAYLASRNLRALSLPGDLDSARQSAVDAIAGIAARDFGPLDTTLCAHCGLAWACESK